MSIEIFVILVAQITHHLPRDVCDAEPDCVNDYLFLLKPWTGGYSIPSSTARVLLSSLIETGFLTKQLTFNFGNTFLNSSQKISKAVMKRFDKVKGHVYMRIRTVPDLSHVLQQFGGSSLNYQSRLRTIRSNSRLKRLRENAQFKRLICL